MQARDLWKLVSILKILSLLASWTDLILKLTVLGEVPLIQWILLHLYILSSPFDDVLAGHSMRVVLWWLLLILKRLTIRVCQPLISCIRNNLSLLVKFNASILAGSELAEGVRLHIHLRHLRQISMHHLLSCRVGVSNQLLSLWVALLLVPADQARRISILVLPLNHKVLVARHLVIFFLYFIYEFLVECSSHHLLMVCPSLRCNGFYPLLTVNQLGPPHLIFGVLGRVFRSHVVWTIVDIRSLLLSQLILLLLLSEYILTDGSSTTPVTGAFDSP